MKLSIIVPVYNTEAYVGKCLDSLLPPFGGAGTENPFRGEDANQAGDAAQLKASYEIIAVNDGSTDGSRAVLSEYCAKYPGIVKAVDTPNGGLGHARNAGLDVASGEWVLCVDSDDYLTPEALPEIFRILDRLDAHDGNTSDRDAHGGSAAAQEPVDIVVFDFQQVDEDGTVLSGWSGCERDTPFTLEEYPEYLFSPMNAVNKLWRRTLFSETGIRFPDRLWFEDLATTPRILLNTRRLLPVHSTWYCYLQRRGSITNATKAQRSIERNTEMITVADTVLEAFRAQGKWEAFKPQLEYMFFYHEFLTSVTRVNLIDPKSHVQAVLRDDYTARFPDYRANPYLKRAPAKYRLLEHLIRGGNWGAVHALMTLNKKAKGR